MARTQNYGQRRTRTRETRVREYPGHRTTDRGGHGQKENKDKRNWGKRMARTQNYGQRRTRTEGEQVQEKIG